MDVKPNCESGPKKIGLQPGHLGIGFACFGLLGMGVIEDLCKCLVGNMC